MSPFPSLRISLISLKMAISYLLPNMKEMLARKYNNCINFEHTVFLTEPYIDYLLALNGFRIVQRGTFLTTTVFFTHASVTLVLCQLIYLLVCNETKNYIRITLFIMCLILDLNQKIAGLGSAQKLFLVHMYSRNILLLSA